MFSKDKAVAYLKQNGQRSLTIIETMENDTIKGVAIWEYESQESREAWHKVWQETTSDFSEKYGHLFEVVTVMPHRGDVMDD